MRHNLRTLTILCGALALGIVIIAWSQWYAASIVEQANVDALPTPVFPDADAGMVYDGRLSDQQMRRMEASLRESDEYDHDYPMLLAYSGDVRAIPEMLLVLERHPMSLNGAAECTRWHCIYALTTLTHANPGYSTNAWKRWWARNKDHLETGPN